MKRAGIPLATALLLVGCGRNPAPPPPPAASASAVRISQRNEPDSLDPATAAIPDDFFIIRALSQGLVSPAPDGGAPLPAAADTWETSADGLTWTFHLRPGAKWSNGDPVSAADFVASCRRVLTPATAAPKADLLYAIRNARAFASGRIADFDAVGLKAPDALTLVVTLEHPDARFLATVATGPWIPVDPRVVAQFGNRWTQPGTFVGNGPFVLAEWKPGQRIVVRRNPLYADAAAVRIDEIQFVRFDDGDSEERAFRAGQVDVTMAVPPSKLDAWRRDNPGSLHHAPLAETRTLVFNTRRPPLDNPKVRLALSLAIDRRRIVDDVLRGGQEPATTVLPPALQGAGESPPAPDPGGDEGPDAARRLLAEAGFPGGRGFPRLEVTGWTNLPVLEAIQAMWRKELGIEVRVALREARVHIAAMREGNFDIGLIALIPDAADPLDALSPFTSSSADNVSRWSDPEFDALVARASGARDEAGRPAPVAAAARRIAALAPVAPLYYNARNWLMNPAVQGWREDALWTRDYRGLALAAAAPTSGRGGTLRVGNGAEPQDLDPQAVTGVPEANIMSGLFEGLVAPDPHDMHPIPGLAESWDVSPDGLTYTFHLRPGLRWSDGSPLTAGDFVQSYKRMLNPAFAAEYAYLIYNFMAGAEDYHSGKDPDFSKVGVKAPDDRTLVVTLKNPTAYLLNILATHHAWYAVPVKTIARYGPLDRKDTGWTRPGRMVGSGPYMLKSWRPNQKIVLVRNPDYWDAAHVRLDSIEFYPIEDEATEERMFRTGQIDITSTLPLAKVDVYRRDHPDELHIEPYLGVYFYRCNVKSPPLNDRRVRLALALAVDRETLVKDVLRGGQQPAYAVSYPGNAGYTPRARLTGGVAEARRLLAEAGYPGGRGLPPIEILYNTSEAHRQIAEAIQAMWRRNLGVDIRLRNEEWKVYLDAEHTHNFQLARAGWIADYTDPHAFLEIWETDNGNNDTQWSNPEYDRLLHQALATKDNAARYELYQKMDAILVDECPVIPIYYYTRVYAMSPKVAGRWPTLLDEHPWKAVHLEP